MSFINSVIDQTKPLLKYSARSVVPALSGAALFAAIKTAGLMAAFAPAIAALSVPTVGLALFASKTTRDFLLSSNLLPVRAIERALSFTAAYTIASFILFGGLTPLGLLTAGLTIGGLDRLQHSLSLSELNYPIIKATRYWT